MCWSAEKVLTEIALKFDCILNFSKLPGGLYVVSVICSFAQVQAFNVGASLWWEERADQPPAGWCFVELSEMKIESQISFCFLEEAENAQF